MSKPGTIQALTTTSPGNTGFAIQLRPYNLKELTTLYGVSAKTLHKWLSPFEKQIGKRRGYYFTIPQVRKIFRLLEFPSMMYEDGM